MRKQVFTMGGLAGTGKSTILTQLYKELKAAGVSVAAAAFTGKAASVLRGKGVSDSSTIHRLQYVPVTDGRGRTVFVRKDNLGASIVFVDEGSMVNGPLWKDLLSFGTKVVVIGDHGQLAPIGDDPKLMENLDYTLTEIHRQAKDNEIITFSHGLRRGQVLYKPKTDAVRFGTWEDFLGEVEDADQLLCGRNDTRTRINAAYRMVKEYDDVLCEGEKIICLQNDYNYGVYNGMTAKVLGVDKTTSGIYMTRIRDEMGQTMVLPILTSQFGDPIRKERRDLPPNVTLWDYGYAISVHKAQGSSWPTVAVFEESVGDDRKRWAYTAATRAEKKLIYCR
jgi:exodeoxyribonuclease-5